MMYSLHGALTFLTSLWQSSLAASNNAQSAPQARSRHAGVPRSKHGECRFCTSHDDAGQASARSGLIVVILHIQHYLAVCDRVAACCSCTPASQSVQDLGV